MPYELRGSDTGHKYCFRLPVFRTPTPFQRAVHAPPHLLSVLTRQTQIFTGSTRLCLRFGRRSADTRASMAGRYSRHSLAIQNNEGVTLSLAPSRVSRWDKPPCRHLLAFVTEGITFQLLPARLHGYLRHLSTHVAILAAAASIHKRQQSNFSA